MEKGIFGFIFLRKWKMECLKVFWVKKLERWNFRNCPVKRNVKTAFLKLLLVKKIDRWNFWKHSVKKNEKN